MKVTAKDKNGNLVEFEINDGNVLKIQIGFQTTIRVQYSPVYGLIVNKSNIDDDTLIVLPRSANEISLK